MKKYTNSILILVLIFFSSTTLYAEVSNEQQAKLWTDLVEAKANPSLSKLGKWNAIEGMTLIKKVDDVGLKAAALATIIGYYDRKEHIWFGDEQLNETMKNWSPEKKALMEDMVKNNGEKFMKHFTELEAESPLSRKRSETRHKDALTYGVDMSRVIEENYLRRSGNDIARATRDFAANRGLAVDVVVRDNFRFDELAGYIDNQNPIILQDKATDNYLICVGYIRRSTEEYLITVDLNKIMFAEVSHTELIEGKGKMAQMLREKDKKLDTKYGLVKRDLKINIVGNMLPGIEITAYRQSSYIAFVIKDFKVTEASCENYLKLIKGNYK